MKKGDGGGWREKPIEEERRKVRREIQARTKRYVPIPEGFDARRASAEQLAAFRLPPRPADKDLLALWEVSLAPPVRFVPPRLDFGSTVAMYQINAAPGDGSGGDTDGAGSGASGRWSTSRNWSGGLILSRRSNRFSQVAAEWRVPPVSAGSGPGPFVCSTWVGLDGYRGWLTSMPQMGTTQVFGDTGAVDDDGNPLPAQYAWCQWWLRGRQQLQLPIILGGVPVLPWHKVVCWVTLLAPDNPDPGDRHWAHFYIRNMTTNVATNLPMAPPWEIPGEPVAARGGTAQWMVERPTALVDSPNGNVSADDLYPIPQFGEVRAENFLAMLEPSPMATIAPTGPPVVSGGAANLRACRRVRMVEVLRAPGSVELLTLVSTANDQSVAVRRK